MSAIAAYSRLHFMQTGIKPYICKISCFPFHIAELAFLTLRIMISLCTERFKAWIGPLVFAMVLFSIPDALQAQVVSLNKNQMATYHTRQLKNGVLLIRLPSQRNKLDKLSEFAGREGENQAYWQQQYNIAREETLAYQKQISLAFSQEYRFSKVMYIYDYQVPLLKDGQPIPLLDMADAEETTIFDPNSTIWYLFSDQLDSKETPYFRIFDKNSQPTAPPFPGKWRKNNIWNVAISMFDARHPTQKSLKKMAKKLNRKLYRIEPDLSQYGY
jgi:hypothetical protein